MSQALAKKHNPDDHFERWIRGITRQLRAARRARSYGTFRIELFDGEIKRALLEESIKDPSRLAPDESEGLG